MYLKESKSQYEITHLLGVNRSTVSCEIKKGGEVLREYTADYAQKDYELCKDNCGIKRKIEVHPIGTYVIDRIKAGWSPETITGRLRREIKEGKQLSDEYAYHESIYQFVWCSQYGKREHLSQYLRYGKRRRTKCQGRRTKYTIIPNRIWIDEKPKAIDQRIDVGRWEGDTIMYGRLKGINSLVERKTRYVILTKLNGKTPEETEQVVVSRLKDQVCSTITFDKSVENRNHERITKQLNTKIYFYHPYYSWEKGTNENTNGLIKQYLHKKTDIVLIPQRDVDDIAWKLNNRPRKVLGFATPQEMLELEYSKLSVVALNPRI